MAKEKHFDGITLDRPLPSIFFPGEIYTLRGTIDNFQGRARVAFELDRIGSIFEESHRFLIDSSSFEVKLHFKEAGPYYLNMKVGDGLWPDPVVVLAAEPTEIERRPVDVISNFRLAVSRQKSQLEWKTENELIQLRIAQAAQSWTFLLSNRPQSFELVQELSEEFTHEDLLFEIRGARSVDGSMYTLASAWSEWQALTIKPVTRLPDQVEPAVDFKVPFPLTGKLNSPVTIELDIRKNFGSRAFIKHPDGRVRTVELDCENGPQSYTYGGTIVELCRPGACQLSFTPDFLGAYIIEINDQESKALINLPFYCGSAKPVIAEKVSSSSPTEMDIMAGRQHLLMRINGIRAGLGLRALRMDSSLVGLSQYYSDRMAKENFCGHFAPDGENLDARKRKFSVKSSILENVGFAQDLPEAQALLERSPAHYMAMTDSSVTRAGLGVSRGIDGRFFVAQHFSPDTLTNADMQSFLRSLLAEMREANPRLERIWAPDERPSIGAMKYHASSPGRLRAQVFVEDDTRYWQDEKTGKLLINRFDQTVDGLFLEIIFYPYVKKTSSERE